MLRPALILLLGLVSASSSVIFIKASRFDPVLLAAGRLLVASALVAPWFFSALSRQRAFFRGHARRTLLPGLVLGVHFISWIIGARLTPAVNSSLLVNMVPLVTPFFLRILAHEKLVGTERVATVVAFSGVLWLVGWDYQLSRDHFLGDVVCFGSMILFAVYLVLARANRDFPELWLYMWPVYTVAALVCLVLTPLSADLAREPWNTRELSIMFGLGLVPTVIGHGSITFALKQLRGQVVGVANLGQVISAGLLAYLILDEVPHASFLPASVLIALGVVLVFRQRR